MPDRDSWIVQLDAPSVTNPSALGGKGRFLHRLVQEGFPVPSGYLITTDATHHLLASNGLEGELAPETVREGTVPDDLREEILTAYRELGGGPVAVRSSGVAEDRAEGSLAGLFESFLNVQGEDALLDAVRGCVASAYSDRARAAGADPEMAVCVQEMVSARVAGILFTRDPLGRRSEMVIEAGSGLGGGVAAGVRTPARLRLDRKTLNVRTRTDTESPLLTAEEIERIGRLGRSVEETLGFPSDLEWAVDEEGAIHCLQARPITALPETEPTDGDLWTCANSQEALEDPVTPMTWSTLAPLVERGRKALFDRLGLPELDGEYLRLFYGRPYFNIDTFRRFLEEVPAAPVEAFDQLIFGDASQVAEFQFPLPPPNSLTFRILGLVFRERAFAKRKLERFLDTFPGRSRRLLHVQPASLTAPALKRHLERVTDLLFEALNLHVLGTTLAGAHYLLLGRFLKRVEFPDPHPETLLLAATKGVKTAECAEALRRLARMAHQEPALESRLLEGEGLDALSDLPGATTFAEAFREFLEKYGHRASQEAELACPRWSEDPSFPLDIVRTYLKSGRFESREAVLRQRKEAMRERVEAHLRSRSRLESWLPVRTTLFRTHLRWAETYAPYRENLRFQGIRMLAGVRRIVLDLGRRLVEKNLLARRTHVFYLTRSEAWDLVLNRETETPSAVRRKIAERRADRVRWFGMDAPSFLRNGEAVTPDEETEGDRLKGVPVSTGKATGPVRICNDLTEGLALESGEILVARAAGPAWTPLFRVAGGVVLEIGGLLSHSAVMAREIGTPCVVGVKGATKTLRSGQLVTVDGGRGEVTAQ